MDKILEQVLEWAKCGIYHNYAEGQFREDNLKILKQVEEKFTSTAIAKLPSLGESPIDNSQQLQAKIADRIQQLYEYYQPSEQFSRDTVITMLRQLSPIA